VPRSPLLLHFKARYTLATKLKSTRSTSLKFTVAETGNKSATKSTVAGTVHFVVNFVAGFGNKSATTWIRQLVAVDFVADTFKFVADTVDFVASVYGAQATRSTFNKVDRVEFNFVASVYRA